MRKVFLSIMMLGKIYPTVYTSTDFELVNENYSLPISYIIENNVEDGEEITVMTCVEVTGNGEGTAEKNCQAYVSEVQHIAEKHNLTVSYEIIPMTSAFTRTTFNYFFKDIALRLHEDDRVYFDFTFGMKPYNISMFIAVSYAVKACKNTAVACAFYAQKFSGGKDSGGVNESRIYDLTGLMYLSDFVGNTQAGDKELADNMLNAIMPKNESED